MNVTLLEDNRNKDLPSSVAADNPGLCSVTLTAVSAVAKAVSSDTWICYINRFRRGCLRFRRLNDRVMAFKGNLN